jgi:hypothetical protein
MHPPRFRWLTHSNRVRADTETPAWDDDQSFRRRAIGSHPLLHP